MTIIQGEEIHRKGRLCGFTAYRFKLGPVTVICSLDERFISIIPITSIEYQYS